MPKTIFCFKKLKEVETVDYRTTTMARLYISVLINRTFKYVQVRRKLWCYKEAGIEEVKGMWQLVVLKGD